MPVWETKKVFIVVKTYPAPSQTSVEVSCTAGVTEDGKWIRLFPIRGRLLSEDKKFKRYQWIQLSTQKASDFRQESYKINDQTIIVMETVPSDKAWHKRKEILNSLKSPSLCDLESRRNVNKKFPTLGFFKPHKIESLEITPDEGQWSATQLEALNRADLFEDSAQRRPLEKVPYKFKYRFRCDDASCNGHNLMCTDWEICEAWRMWKNKYGDNWEKKFREKFEQQMIEEFDTHFFVGTHSAHPNRWLIVGLFYPPRVPAPTIGSLFDL